MIGSGRSDSFSIIHPSIHVLNPEQLIAPGDIGIAGTLCALASLPRSAIKSQLLENDSFSIYIEYEPHVRELVEAYMASKFSAVLDLLEKYSVSKLVATMDSVTHSIYP